MHVDDSAVVRALTRRWIEEDPRFELVRSCIDGEQAIAQAATAKPDVIILDVEMPKMDGLAALPGLRKAAPQARVIMASTLTSRGASTTVRALGLGAADYIAKPDSKILGSADTYRRELVEKMLALGGRAVNPVTPATRKSNYQNADSTNRARRSSERHGGGIINRRPGRAAGFPGTNRKTHLGSDPDRPAYAEVVYENLC
jgi:chemotaxis response regulator CheB